MGISDHPSSHPTVRRIATISLTLVLLAACGRSPGDSGDGTATFDDTFTADDPPAASAPIRPLSTGKDMDPLDEMWVPPVKAGDIKDWAAARKLGKALFWDIQVGSDGETSCATCHSVGGADGRKGGVGYENIVYGWDSDSSDDDVVGSLGVYARSNYTGYDDASAEGVDKCDAPATGSKKQVTGMNAPSVIGALYFKDLFWNGRASQKFNGVDPSGAYAGYEFSNGDTHLDNSALASQSTGPANNAVEMACHERLFDGPIGLGKKLVYRKPLANQYVSKDDPLLGKHANYPDKGFNSDVRYYDLIRAAFGKTKADRVKNGHDFAAVWGQAVQAYERTLIPSQTPFDKYLKGDSKALSDKAKRGFNVFTGKGSCSECHASRIMSDATVQWIQENGPYNGSGADQGYHNLGVKRTMQQDANGNWSDIPGVDLGRHSISENKAEANKGAYKTPHLMNVELTGPYMHNGRFATLEEVVEFYNRGGDFPEPGRKSKDMKKLDLDTEEVGELVAFLKALTDPRVKNGTNVFSHPSLPDTDGPSGSGCLPVSPRPSTGPSC